MLGYNSPMTTYLSPQPPLYEEFREFFFTGYGLDPNAHKLDCKHISVLFLWRYSFTDVEL